LSDAVSVEVTYERTHNGMSVQVHTLYPENVVSYSDWIVEVWHNLTRLRPCERAGMERWYELRAAKGDSIAIDCYSMPRRVFGPRARLDVNTNGVELAFIEDMEVTIARALAQIALEVS
jgi:hypothetical protein